MKIVLVSGWMAMGGAERAMKLLAEGLHERGHEVTLITIMGTHRDFYSIGPEITRIDLNLVRSAPSPLHSLKNTGERAWRLRRELKRLQPQVVLSFLDRINILALLATRGTGIPAVISIRNYPTRIGATLKALGRFLYPSAAMLVSVSSGIDSFYSQWIPAHKRAVINNVPSDLRDQLTGEQHLQHPAAHNIVSMGRLHPQKNFPLLMRAFRQLAEEFPDWYLTIIGDGKEREALLALNTELGMQERIFFPGKINNPFPTLHAADFFALSSHLEGVPNVVLEAMACGLPILSSDYLGEPRDIIRDGVDGLIVARDDEAAMVAGLRHMMGDADARANYARNASTVLERLTLDKFLDEWEAVFRRVTRP